MLKFAANLWVHRKWPPMIILGYITVDENKKYPVPRDKCTYLYFKNLKDFWVHFFSFESPGTGSAEPWGKIDSRAMRISGPGMSQWIILALNCLTGWWMGSATCSGAGEARTTTWPTGWGSRSSSSPATPPTSPGPDPHDSTLRRPDPDPHGKMRIRIWAVPEGLEKLKYKFPDPHPDPNGEK